MENVAIITSRGNGRITVNGLSPEELDELYGNMEREFGESAISASVGPPYTFVVERDDEVRLYLRIRDFCEQAGYEVAPD